MALNDISLTAGMRNNLISLQGTTSLLSRTQDRLSSGKKVNSALDNPTNFFAAQSHTQRAADLTTRKDGMTEAVQAVQAANKGITGITALIEAAKGLTQAARSADATNRDTLAQQFNTVLDQISALASDSGYKGKNFLNADSLQVLFNENGSSSLTISGFNSTATAGLGISGIVAAVSGTTTDGSAIGGATTINSGTLVGSGTTINIATHTGTLASATDIAGYVATGNYFAHATNLTTGLEASGDSFVISGLGFTGLAGLSTSGTNFVITSVTVCGLATGTGMFTVLANTGTSGNLTVYLSTGFFTTGDVTTGASISFTFRVAEHFSQGSGVGSNLTVFNLKTGDVGSGLQILDTSGAGFQILVSGSAIATGSAWLNASGTQIIFTGIGIPGANDVTYTYNTGFATSGVEQIAARTMNQMDYTGTALLSGEVISQVRINGTAVDSGYYAIANNVVTFNNNALTDNLLHSGDVVGITTKHAQAIITATLSGTETITAGSVTVSGTAIDSGLYTISGNTIVINSGAFANGNASGATIGYTVATAAVGGGWSGDAGIDNSVTQLNTAIETLRTKSANLASNLSVVTIRQDFTDGMVNTLLKGADNLTLADMNEEGANMLMLQTRQQLGTTSLKMASDAAQSVLRLF